MQVTVIQRGLSRVVALRPGEAGAVGWSFAYFFCLIAGYYVLRPLRDEMGIAGGVRQLPWLFTATLVVMLAVVPVFGALVAWLPRRRFIPLVYHFFVVNLALFWVLLTFGLGKVHVARVFFVWISVFNLFAVSVFWSFMADLYAVEQGKRLFGFIAAGGSAGGLLGPLITVGLARSLGPENLLIVAALLLEAAVFFALRLEASAAWLRTDTAPAPNRAGSETLGRAEGTAVGGSWLAGFALLARSRYLAGIALWVALLSVSGTFLYLVQADIVAKTSDDPAVRTRIFATIDLVVGVLTILIQLFATGKIIPRLGVGPAAALLPLVFGVGFLVLGWAPVLGVIIVFQALQRTANFAVSNPAREALFTVLAREEKYKTKNLIDLAVFRGGDAASGWLFAALRGSGFDPAGIALLAVPIAAGWLALALVLGRMQERRAGVAPAPVRQA